MKRITLKQPDDWHLHLRDDVYLATTVPHSAAQFARAIIMPNLKPPVTTVALAKDYLTRIEAHIPASCSFKPLMTLYLTQAMTPAEIRTAHASEHVFAVKWYPAGATTNSEQGVHDIHQLDDVLATMAELQLPLLIHGEVTDYDIDIFDREAVFITTLLKPILARHPNLRVVLEHITTADAVDFVLASGENVAATITPHHLLLNRNDLLVGGIKPHHYCLPVLKREQHRQALVRAATSGHAKFFLGTDSAPHEQGNKENTCGCAGIYSAHAAMSLYAEVFDQADALEHLESFASFNGPKFYGLPPNAKTITLNQESWSVPASYPFGEHAVVPFRAGEQLSWKVANITD